MVSDDVTLFKILVYFKATTATENSNTEPNVKMKVLSNLNIYVAISITEFCNFAN